MLSGSQGNMDLLDLIMIMYRPEVYRAVLLATFVIALIR